MAGALALGAGSALVPAAWAQQEGGGELEAEAFARGSGIYLLDLQYDKPRQIAVGREPYVEHFWYVTFVLANQDSEDHPFFLEVSAESDKGVTYRPVQHPEVERIVRGRLGLAEGEPLWTAADLTIRHAEQPLPPRFPTEIVEPVIRAGQRLRCVAIFKGWHPEANHLTITFRGLTNDVRLEPAGRPHERKLLERVFRVEYYRPGDEFFPHIEALQFVGHRWETVERVVKTDLE